MNSTGELKNFLHEPSAYERIDIRPHVADVHSKHPVVPRPISADHGEGHLVHKQAEASEAL